MTFRVLVVDDDPLTLHAVRRTLIHAGHQASVLQGGFGFAVALRDFRPDVVLLDVNMPGLNGLGALRSARELHKVGQARPRIILHSGEAEEELKRLCLALGSDGYVCKPATRAVLLAAIDAAGAAAAQEPPSAVSAGDGLTSRS